MTFKLVPPGAPRTSSIKTGALFAFRFVRSVQSNVAKVPGVLAQTRDDIAAAWRESASPNV